MIKKGVRSMTCPIGKKECPCLKYSKEELCDWPYEVGMGEDEIREISRNITFENLVPRLFR